MELLTSGLLILVIGNSYTSDLRDAKLFELIYGNPTNRNCVCGLVNNLKNSNTLRIIGGNRTDPNQYPWLVEITYEGTFICGGSVINDRYILSAAHCLSPKIDLQGNLDLELALLKIVTGSYNRCIPTTRTTIFSVENIKLHPNTNVTNFHSDIMLLKTNMKISFNKYVRPVCLPKIDSNFAAGSIDKFVETKEIPIVIGWGSIDGSTLNSSCYTRQVEMPILRSALCTELDRVNGYERPITLFCAGNGHVDACQGDSGGPIQIKDRFKIYYQIGIVSNGFGCGVPFRPGYYTDLLQFIPWIRKHTMNAAYCW